MFNIKRIILIYSIIIRVFKRLHFILQNYFDPKIRIDFWSPNILQKKNRPLFWINLITAEIDQKIYSVTPKDLPL